MSDIEMNKHADPEQYQEKTGFRWSLKVGYDRVVIRGKITLNELETVLAMIKKDHWILDMNAAKQLDAMFVFTRPKD